MKREKNLSSLLPPTSSLFQIRPWDSLTPHSSLLTPNDPTNLSAISKFHFSCNVCDIPLLRCLTFLTFCDILLSVSLCDRRIPTSSETTLRRISQ